MGRSLVAAMSLALGVAVASGARAEGPSLLRPAPRTPYFANRQPLSVLRRVAATELRSAARLDDIADQLRGRNPRLEQRLRAQAAEIRDRVRRAYFANGYPPPK